MQTQTSYQKSKVLDVVERSSYIDVYVCKFFSLFLENLFTSEVGSFMFLLFCHIAHPLYIYVNEYLLFVGRTLV